MFRGLLRVGVSFGPKDLRQPSRRPFRCSPQHPVHNIPSSDRRHSGCRANALASCRSRSACCSFPHHGTHGSHLLTWWAGVGLFRPRAHSSFSTNPAVFDSRIYLINRLYELTSITSVFEREATCECRAALQAGARASLVVHGHIPTDSLVGDASVLGASIRRKTARPGPR
jgi:hypothetical protein